MPQLSSPLSPQNGSIWQLYYNAHAIGAPSEEYAPVCLARPSWATGVDGRDSYTLMPANSNQCEEGFTRIPSRADCVTAVSVINTNDPLFSGMHLSLTSPPIEAGSASTPKGCYLDTSTKEAHFNGHATGAPASGLAPICRRRKTWTCGQGGPSQAPGHNYALMDLAVNTCAPGYSPLDENGCSLAYQCGGAKEFGASNPCPGGSTCPGNLFKRITSGSMPKGCYHWSSSSPSNFGRVYYNNHATGGSHVAETQLVCRETPSWEGGGATFVQQRFNSATRLPTRSNNVWSSGCDLPGHVPIVSKAECQLAARHAVPTRGLAGPSGFGGDTPGGVAAARPHGCYLWDDRDYQRVGTAGGGSLYFNSNSNGVAHHANAAPICKRISTGVSRVLLPALNDGAFLALANSGIRSAVPPSIPHPYTDLANGGLSAAVTFGVDSVCDFDVNMALSSVGVTNLRGTTLTGVDNLDFHRTSTAYTVMLGANFAAAGITLRGNVRLRSSTCMFLPDIDVSGTFELTMGITAAASITATLELDQASQCLSARVTKLLVSDLRATVANNNAYTLTLNGIPNLFTRAVTPSVGRMSNAITSAVQAQASTSLALLAPTLSANCFLDVAHLALTELPPLDPFITSGIIGPSGFQCPTEYQMGFAEARWPRLGTAQSDTCPTFRIEPCLNSAQTAIREQMLEMLARHNLGMQDNAKWSEYDPSCATVGSRRIQLAEPLNALSNAAFDHLTCSGVPAEYERIHDAALTLGFGSFAFHATGGLSYTGDLDDVGIMCVAVSIYYAFAHRTSTPMFLTLGRDNDLDGTAETNVATYDMDALSQACSQDVVSILDPAGGKSAAQVCGDGGPPKWEGIGPRRSGAQVNPRTCAHSMAGCPRHRGDQAEPPLVHDDHSSRPHRDHQLLRPDRGHHHSPRRCPRNGRCHVDRPQEHVHPLIGPYLGWATDRQPQQDAQLRVREPPPDATDRLHLVRRRLHQLRQPRAQLRMRHHGAGRPARQQCGPRPPRPLALARRAGVQVRASDHRRPRVSPQEIKNPRGWIEPLARGLRGTWQG